MAGGNNRINFQIGYTVDKSGLQQMQSLFQQIANRAKEPGQELNTGLQQAAKTAEVLDGILEKTFNTNLGTLNVTKFNQELAKSKLTLKDVQTNLAATGNQGATAYNRLAQAILGTNQQLKQSSKLLDSMATTMANTVKWGVTSSIFNNITASIQNAYVYSKQLNTSLNDIRIVTDQSADNMEQFAIQANTAAKNLGASTLDYTNAALIYYQQGLSDQEVQARAETTIKAANVTGQRGEEVSEQLTAVWNGYKVTAEETELYVDKLAAVAATTAADLEELSVGMSKVASAANAMGVDFDDLNAQIATIVSVTRQAPESVGTALKTIYARLGDLQVDGVDEFGVSLGKVSQQMAQMGIQILDQNGDLRDMSSVIAEVAEKWNGWTSAQRQAAAVAMAGKRQYNNLIALFDNWDMYSDALETSADAMGTLQHQQDIYMESTTAKLKTLKATWQDLYDGLIDDDEIGAGIDALTNLVQVFDNFVDSFGGGLKSIAGFGAVVSSIFNKQITNGINEAIQRQEVFKQNLELAQANAQIRQQGVAQLGKNASAQDLAVQANTEKQLEYAQKIYDARVGLNQEQYNTLTGYQQEIGHLEEISTLAQKQIENIQERNNFSKEEIAYLEQEKLNSEEINTTYYERTQQAQAELDRATELLNIYRQEGVEQEDLVHLQTQLLTLSTHMDEESQRVVQNFVEELKVTENLEDLDKRIVETLLQIQEANRDNLQIEQQKERAANRIAELYTQQGNAQEQQNNIKQQADAMLKLGNNATTVAQRVTLVTSSLGNMAMAWSSINSLIQTWNDDSTSFGDKITQTFMTLGMTIPMLTSNLSKLNEALKFTESVTSLATLKTEAKTAADIANNAVITQGGILNQEKINKILSVISAEELEKIATNEETASEIAYQAAQKLGIAINDNYVKAIMAQVAAKKAATSATSALTAATLGFVGIALTAVIAGLAVYSAHLKEVREEAKQTAEESLKLANDTKSQVDANGELVKSFEDLKQQYEDGSITKDQLKDTTDKLIEAYGIEGDRIAALTGDYNKLTESIKRKQKQEEEDLIKQQKQSISDSTRSAAEQGRTAPGLYQWGDNLHANLGTANNFQNISKEAKKSFSDIFGDLNSNGVITINPKDTQEVLGFYQKLIKYRETLVELGEEDSNIYKSVSEMIDALNAEGDIDNIIAQGQNYIDSILNSEHLEDIADQVTFDNAIKSIQNNLKSAIKEGFISEDTDIDTVIADFLMSLDNKFAEQFIIDKSIEEKFGDHINESLKNAFSQYDVETQKGILKLGFNFDFDDNEIEEGKEALENYAKLVTNTQNGTYAIPVGFQSQLNESILKGKDIAKADWDTMLSYAPDAEELFGNRDSFNNKSIGERISLMEQLNALTRENNTLSIENYEETKQASEEVLNDLNRQIEELTNRAQQIKNNIGTIFKSPEEVNQAQEDIAALEDQINDLESEKHEVEISIDIEQSGNDLLDTMIGDVVSEADKLIVAAESVGEAWTVAADDVANFASAFPELMSEVEYLADGSIRLNQQMVNETLAGNQAIMESDKNVVIAAIDNKLAQLQAERNFQIAKINILSGLLNNEISQADAEEQLNQAVADFKTDLENQGLQNQATAINASLVNNETGVKGMINTLESLNQAIEVINTNYSNMLVEGASMMSLPGVSGGTRVSASSISNNVNNNLSSSDINALQSQLDDAKGRLSEIDSQIAGYSNAKSKILSNTSKANTAANRVQGGKAGKADNSKSKNGGGKGSSKEKDKKEWDEEFDRYWKLNKTIDTIDRAVEKLDKDQEHLHGKQLINSLKKENELLKEQANNYKKLRIEQKKEAGELQGTLKKQGVKFDKEGNIKNYSEATKKAIDYYNSGKWSDEQYELFKKSLERYDTLFYEEMKENEEKLEENRRQRLENNLKKWETKIEVKLELKEAKRQWNDFIAEMSKDFRKVYPDTSIEINRISKNINTYVGKGGTLDTDKKAIADIEAEIDKLATIGKSSKYNSISEAQEALKEARDTWQEDVKALNELYQDAWDTLLDGIDQFADKFDVIQDRFEKINDELSYQKELIELIYGDEAYDLIDSFYSAQETANLKRIESLRTETDAWKKQLDNRFAETGHTLDNFFEWNEDEKKYYEQWQEAQSKLKDEVVNDIKTIQEQYSNSINAIMLQLEKGLAGGSRLDDIELQWERISANADKYYDSTEKAYQIQTLSNKINKDIAATNNLKTQQRLEEFREKELAELQAKDKLTEYDIKRAEARYELMQKQIALENSQNNKASMKLTRNEQGNWSYQYVADDSDIASKRQDLLDSWNALYQLASDAYESNLKSLQNLQKTYLEQSKANAELALTNKDLATQRQLELDKWYYEQYQLLADENSEYRTDLEIATVGVLKTVYEQDIRNYKDFTDEQKSLIDEVKGQYLKDYLDVETAVKENIGNIGEESGTVLSTIRSDWNSLAQKIANNWNKDNGESVTAIIKNAYSEIQSANSTYISELQNLQAVSGETFGENGIKGNIDAATSSLDSLSKDTKTLAETDLPNWTKKMTDKIGKIKKAWEKVALQLKTVNSEIETYLKKVQAASKVKPSTIKPGAGTTASGNTSSGGSAGGTSSGGSKSGSSGGNKGVTYWDAYSAVGANYNTKGTKVGSKIATSEKGAKEWANKNNYNVVSTNSSGHYIIVTKKRISVTKPSSGGGGGGITQYQKTYATGGYTGTWNNGSDENNGRWAVLHQKELVLNKEDTSNFLSGIQMIRDMSSLNGSINNSILKAISNMMLSLPSMNTRIAGGHAGNGDTQNVFNITAEFPNAENVNEIREAILSLPNIASQYIN